MTSQHDAIEILPAPRESSAQTLSDFAQIANTEHTAVLASTTAMLRHAVRAGHALNSARERLGWGEFMPWLAENFSGSRTHASLYRRLALHQDALGEREFSSLRAAERYLIESGHTKTLSRRPEALKQRIQEVRQLRDRGMAPSEIAKLYDVNISTIYMWLRPDRKAVVASRNQRTRKMRLALQRHARDRAARNTKSPVADAYAQIRKLTQIVDFAIQAEQNNDAKAALNSALHRSYLVEDEIVKALGITTGDLTDLYAASKYQGRIALKTKLTPRQTAEVRKLYAAGNVSQEDLAERFGVSCTTLGKVVSDMATRTYTR